MCDLCEKIDQIKPYQPMKAVHYMVALIVVQAATIATVWFGNIITSIVVGVLVGILAIAFEKREAQIVHAAKTFRAIADEFSRRLEEKNDVQKV